MDRSADDGHLDLDDEGHVVGAAARAVDLIDEPHPPTRAQAWWATHVRPHAGLIAAGAIGAAAVIGVGTWWLNRPPPPSPGIDFTIASQADGVALAAPRFEGFRAAAVTYTVAAPTPGDQLRVLGLAGPGLVSDAVADTTVVPGPARTIELHALLDCRDPKLPTAKAADYAVKVERTDVDGVVSSHLVPLPPRPAIASAVLHHCLAFLAQESVSLRTITLNLAPGLLVGDVVLGVVNNTSGPLTMSVVPLVNGNVEFDASEPATVQAGTNVFLTAHVMVQDCGAPTDLLPMFSLPGSGSRDDARGVLLRVSLGAATGDFAYPVPDSALPQRIGQIACVNAPHVTLRVHDAVGRNTGGGTWAVHAIYDVRTGGQGVYVGAQNFAPGSTRGDLVAAVQPAGTPWASAPAELNGGAGSLAVDFTGRCADLRSHGPPTLAVAVETPNKGVYRYRIASTEDRLLAAALIACGFTVEHAAYGWEENAAPLP